MSGMSSEEAILQMKSGNPRYLMGKSLTGLLSMDPMHVVAGAEHQMGVAEHFGIIGTKA